MEHIAIYSKPIREISYNDEPDEVVSRVVNSDHDDNYWINYNGDTYKVRKYSSKAATWSTSTVDGQHEPVKRYKKVFSRPSDVCHAWVHQKTSENFGSEGRSRNCFYEGDTLYSYGSHFELAKFINIPGRDKPFVLINGVSYSQTTSAHQSDIRSAVNGVYDYMVVYPSSEHVGYSRGNYLLFDYGTNAANKDHYIGCLKHWYNQITEFRESASRKIKPSTLRWLISDFITTQHQAMEFIELFRCKSIVPAEYMEAFTGPLFESYSEFREVAERVLTYEMRKALKDRNKTIRILREAGVDIPEDIKDRDLYDLRKTHSKKVKAFKFADKLKEGLDNIQKWRRGLSVNAEKYNGVLSNIGWSELTISEINKITGNNFRDEYTKTLLRLRTFEHEPFIETSKRVDLSIDEVRQANAIYERYAAEAIAKSQGPRDFVNINGRMNLANFTSVPAVNSEGVFKYGCHYIAPSEREYIMEQIVNFKMEKQS